MGDNGTCTVVNATEARGARGERVPANPQSLSPGPVGKPYAYGCVRLGPFPVHGYVRLRLNACVQLCTAGLGTQGEPAVRTNKAACRCVRLELAAVYSFRRLESMVVCGCSLA